MNDKEEHIAVKDKMKNFLSAWKKSAFGVMYNNTTDTYRKMHDNYDDIKARFQTKISTYAVERLQMQSPVICDVVVRVYINKTKLRYRIRLVKENGPYNASEHGDWGIFPGSVRKR